MKLRSPRSQRERHERGKQLVVGAELLMALDIALLKQRPVDLAGRHLCDRLRRRLPEPGSVLLLRLASALDDLRLLKAELLSEDGVHEARTGVGTIDQPAEPGAPDPLRPPKDPHHVGLR